MKEEHEKSIKELTDRVMALSDLNLAKEKEVVALDVQVFHYCFPFSLHFRIAQRDRQAVGQGKCLCCQQGCITSCSIGRRKAKEYGLVGYNC